jgi:hypothetical protein
VNKTHRELLEAILGPPAAAIALLANRPLLSVATDAAQEAHAFLEKQGIALQALKSGPDVVPLMRRAGKHSGGLPFTVVLRDGRILGSHEGELSERTLERLRAAVKEDV